MKNLIPWVGSTKKSADIIAAIINREGYAVYCEPMVGAASVFFALKPPMAVLSDIEPLLVNMYKQIRDYPVSVVRDLQRHDTTKEYFLELQERIDFMSDVERASAFFYLMTVCYNGKFRRTGGKLALTFGDRNKTWDKRFKQYVRRIYSASVVLTDTEIREASYEDVRGFGDMTFFDPPWVDSKVDYGVRFDHETLASELDDWPGKWLMTINDCAETRRLFLPLAKWRLTLTPYYTLSSQSGRRHKDEMLLASFKPRLFCE